MILGSSIFQSLPTLGGPWGRGWRPGSRLVLGGRVGGGGTSAMKRQAPGRDVASHRGLQGLCR